MMLSRVLNQMILYSKFYLLNFSLLLIIFKFLLIPFFLIFLAFLLCSNKVLFEDNECRAKVQHIADAFRPTGLLGSEAATVGINVIADKYAGSEKLVVPLWICVSF